MCNCLANEADGLSVVIEGPLAFPCHMHEHVYAHAHTDTQQFSQFFSQDVLILTE